MDDEWREYALQAESGQLGLVVPPVLSIVLSRSAKREAIPSVLADLRNEWADARKKVWKLVSDLRNAPTLREANDQKRELAEASRLFSPKSEQFSASPLRFFWEISLAAVAGAVLTGVAGGNVSLGATAQSVIQAVRIAQGEMNFAKLLFGRGAFDLARRVRRELQNVPPVRALLSTFLTETEKRHSRCRFKLQTCHSEIRLNASIATLKTVWRKPIEPPEKMKR